ncbi:MAG TPA: zf-HC2 domain-containing protein [Pyrinomonadaceae bacterium]|nr:zf-HC2 domain-containing protein [Pyrinomonadaceae bacterium]
MIECAATLETQAGCGRAAQVAAYLDAELDAEEAAAFESHSKGCPVCSAALLEQRRLLCLLDTAFDETFAGRLELPRDFAREMKARAQTDMSGVRERDERRRAVKICAVLSAAAFALLGAAAFDAVTGPLRGAARAAAGVAGMAGHAAADAGTSAGLLARAVGGRLLASSGAALALQAAAVFGALALLLWLIASYHRSGQRK